MFNQIDQHRDIDVENGLTKDQIELYEQYAPQVWLKRFNEGDKQSQMLRYKALIDTLDHIPEYERETYLNNPSKRVDLLNNASIHKQLFERYSDRLSNGKLQQSVNQSLETDDFGAAPRRIWHLARHDGGRTTRRRATEALFQLNKHRRNKLALRQIDLDEQEPQLQMVGEDDHLMEMDDVQNEVLEKKQEFAQQKIEQRQQRKDNQINEPGNPDFVDEPVKNEPVDVKDPYENMKHRFELWEQHAGIGIAGRGIRSTFKNRYDFVDEHVTELYDNMDNPSGWGKHDKRDYKRFFKMKNGIDKAFIEGKFDDLNEKDRSRAIWSIMGNNDFNYEKDEKHSPREGDGIKDHQAFVEYYQYLQDTASAPGAASRSEIVGNQNREMAGNILEQGYGFLEYDMEQQRPKDKNYDKYLESKKKLDRNKQRTIQNLDNKQQQKFQGMKAPEIDM